MNGILFGVLIVLVIVLFIAFLLFFSKYKNQSAQIDEIKKGISEFVDEKAKGKIMVFSNEKSIQKLLVQINKLLEKQVRLEVAQKRQEESSNRMLSNISHDLKTPLTVILGYSELLINESKDMEKSSKDKLLKIQGKTKDVLEMTETFFDVVKLENAEYALQLEEVNLCELCREEIINYYSILESSGFEVDIEIAEQPVLIRGDCLAIKRALSNLIQNAIRYGTEGKYLKLKVFEKEDKAYVEVEDRGKGIVENSQEKIFERLVTLEDSRNKKYQGSGLGLTITKRLIESMGGTIRLDSTPYKKTIFTIILPLDK